MTSSVMVLPVKVFTKIQVLLLSDASTSSVIVLPVKVFTKIHMYMVSDASTSSVKYNYE